MILFSELTGIVYNVDAKGKKTPLDIRDIVNTYAQMLSLKHKVPVDSISLYVGTEGAITVIAQKGFDEIDTIEFLKK